MSTELKFHFFGWCLEPVHNSDKIWGWFSIDDKVYNFWGPRGTAKLVKIKFKQFTKYPTFHDNSYEVRKVARDKMHKGYKSIDVAVDSDNKLGEVEKIYPGFTDHLKKQMFIAKLSGDIKGAE